MLTDLIRLIETAPGGSPKLDQLIERALRLPPGPYSRSLDGAFSLLPEGWSIATLAHHHDCRGNFTGWLAELYQPNQAIIPCPQPNAVATAPLAVCASALRVRDSLAEMKIRAA